MQEQQRTFDTLFVDVNQTTEAIGTHLFTLNVLLFTLLIGYLFFFKVLDRHDRKHLKELTVDCLDKIKSKLITRNKNKISNEINSLSIEIDVIKSKYQFKQIPEKTINKNKPKKANKKRNRKKVVFNSNLYQKGDK